MYQRDTERQILRGQSLLRPILGAPVESVAIPLNIDIGVARVPIRRIPSEPVLPKRAVPHADDERGAAARRRTLQILHKIDDLSDLSHIRSTDGQIVDLRIRQ